MKIGILTFHWGANHGAVLQAYATQRYLGSKGFDAEIIDYYPVNLEKNLKNTLKPTRPSLMISKFGEYIKNIRIEQFRKEYLKRSKRYKTNKELSDDPPDCDILITGSDQVWNTYYLLSGEKKATPVYFLNFGKEGCKRIALSISFGCTDYPTAARDIALPYILKFDAISVREKTGVDILAAMGIEDVSLTADPTVLLTREDYLKLCEKIPARKSKTVAVCMLRKLNTDDKKMINGFKKRFRGHKFINIKNAGMEEWLAGIRDSELVITNSFHCVMMCLKLHKSFYVLPAVGNASGMNDRFYTLLSGTGLESRVLKENGEIDHTDEITSWDQADIKLEHNAKLLEDYLEESM